MAMTDIRVLGIETSCDETAVAIVNDKKDILGHVVYTQATEHLKHGGVVPEIGARAHVEKIDSVVKQCLKDANLSLKEIDAVAATCGPGLIGGVMVGSVYAKALAAGQNKPFIAVNHLEGHVLTPRLTDNLDFPYLCLLVSGGHTQFLHVQSLTEITLLGQTRDDAIGEAYDKFAKMIGLPYPGGPAIEKLATECTDTKNALENYPLPRPLMQTEGCDFSFSGLKTAVRNYIEQDKNTEIARNKVQDLAFSFQEAIVETVFDRTSNALSMLKDDNLAAQCFAIVGGVSANKRLREALSTFLQSQDVTFHAAPLSLCTDNGAMIAWAGLERYKANLIDDISFRTRPRWPVGTRV